MVKSRWNNAEILDFKSLDTAALTLSVLREMHGDKEARFKSIEQEQAVEMAVKREHDVLVILPTGGGKSLIFMLLAWLENDRTTIVIVPFIALMEDMMERCLDMGLSCQIWRESKQLSNDDTAQIVLVAVEHAVTVQFQQLLIRL